MGAKSFSANEDAHSVCSIHTFEIIIIIFVIITVIIIIIFIIIIGTITKHKTATAFLPNKLPSL